MHRALRRDHAQRGGVTILVLVVLVFGCLLTLGVSRLGVAMIGRARAATAADAAALAAADALARSRGEAAACADADQTAASNGARLVSCDCDRNSAAVVVDLDLGPIGTARGRAKAEVELARDLGRRSNDEPVVGYLIVTSKLAVSAGGIPPSNGLK